MSAEADRPAISALPGRRLEAPQDAGPSLGELLTLRPPLAGWNADERARLRALAESAPGAMTGRVMLQAMDQTDEMRSAYEAGTTRLDDLLRAVATETRTRVQWEMLEERPNMGVVWQRQRRTRQQESAETNTTRQREEIKRMRSIIPELWPTALGASVEARLKALGSGLKTHGFRTGVGAASLRTRLRELDIPIEPLTIR